MARVRIQRFEKELLKLISNTVNYKLRDKHLEFVTITSVKLSNDFSHAKIFYTHMEKYPEAEIFKALKRSSGVIKSTIAKKQLMRKIPELTFQYDKVEENARKLDKLFEQIKSE